MQHLLCTLGGKFEVFLIDAFVFEPNSVRKLSDTFQGRNNFVPEDVQLIYLSQTSAKTWQEHYTAPALDQNNLRLFQLQSQVIATSI